MGASPPLGELDKKSARRGWYLVVAAALAVSLVSWATNITTEAQLSGQADGFLTVRRTFSKLANSGTIWAGLGMACGWFVRRPLPAAVAGILGSLLSLIAHYALGRISGMFTATIWGENLEWFVAAMILGGPLGLVGATARRVDVWGLAARLMVPLGAVLEPFVKGMFLHPLMTAPHHTAALACGVILFLGGAMAGTRVVINAVQRSREKCPEPVGSGHSGISG